MNKNLELRMYGFVPYQLTGIQSGIQMLHAIVEYGLLYGDTPQYVEWATNHKTVILLDGGTTNDVGEELGSLNMIKGVLSASDIPHAFFREPDLQNALTAVCFIADERVFNTKEYPNWEDTYDFKEFGISGEKFIEGYNFWLSRIGGVENRTIRELIDGKRLATN